jgi:hypothetical protein
MPDAVLVRLTQKIVAVPIRIIIIIIYRDVVCAARGHQSLGSSEGVMCFLELIEQIQELEKESGDH